MAKRKTNKVEVYEKPHYKTNFELVRTILTMATFVLQLIIATHLLGGF